LNILVNNVQTTVTINLYDALWQLRALKIYEIWVDAICINQEDKTERSLQVRFMKRIYEKARGVIAWLGTESKNCSDALDFLNQALTPGSSTRKTSERQRSALRFFFDLPYWTRVWIIQEVAVGSSVSILCGHYQADWSILDSVDKLAPTFDTIGLRHVRQVRSFRQKYQDSKRIALIEAMRKSQAAQSTDPRDKIYALLGLTYDGDDLVPYPNYRQSISEVLRDFTKAVIKSNKSLDYILFTPLGNIKQEGIPTWVVDWVGLRGRKRNFLDIEIFPSNNLTMVELSDPNMLRVRGRFVGRVLDTFDRIAGSKSFLEVDDLIQRYYNKNNNLPNAISDAICASLCLQKVEELDRLLKGSRRDFFSMLWPDNGQLDPDIHGRMLQYLAKEPSRLNQLGLELNSRFESEFDMSTQLVHDANGLILWLVRTASCQIAGKSIKQWLSPGRASTSIATGLVAKVLQRITQRRSDYSTLIRSVVAFYQNRLKLVVTDEGMIGAAPAIVQPHDEIYLLAGTRGNTPVLLRRGTIKNGEDVCMLVSGIFLSGQETTLQTDSALITSQNLTIA
jgi:hypothetical protein